jgi:hypothetical protein
MNDEAKAAECAALQRLRPFKRREFAPAFGVRRIPPLLLESPGGTSFFLHRLYAIRLGAWILLTPSPIM